MILHWQQVLLKFSSRVDPLTEYENSLDSGDYDTHSLLCCNWSTSAGNERRVVNTANGPHAEVNLVRSSIWRNDIPQALASFKALGSTRPMVVVLAINRSPCDRCAEVLADAVDQLENQFPLMHERTKFVLASRGLYIGKGDTTTEHGLRLLSDSGWRQCALAFKHDEGKWLTPRGKALVNMLARVRGQPFTRLEIERLDA